MVAKSLPGALPIKCRCIRDKNYNFYASKVYRVETKTKGTFLCHWACAPEDFKEYVLAQEAAERQLQREKMLAFIDRD